MTFLHILKLLCRKQLLKDNVMTTFLNNFLRGLYTPTWVYQNVVIIKINTSIFSKFTYYGCNKVFDIGEKLYFL